jgi:hypothetical protein
MFLHQIRLQTQNFPISTKKFFWPLCKLSEAKIISGILHLAKEQVQKIQKISVAVKFKKPSLYDKSCHIGGRQHIGPADTQKPGSRPERRKRGGRLK